MGFSSRVGYVESIAEDLTDLVAGRGGEPAGKLFGFANRVEALGQAQPSGSEGVVACFVVERHHVDRLPDHPLEERDECSPRVGVPRIAAHRACERL